MLSSAKIGTSSWRYYSDGVACRATDYYAGVGEAPGRWHGRGLEHLGLELLQAANLVTLARTAVERDFKGDVVDAHQPEAPTRFAKYLGQIVRGGLALGMPKDDAILGARRVAGDSVPPLRLLVLADVMAHPGSRTSEVTKRLQKPRSTVDRALQELHVIGLLVVDEAEVGRGFGGGGGWMYSLHPGIDRTVLSRLVTRNVSKQGSGEQEERTQAPPGTDKSGDALPADHRLGDDEVPV